MSRVVEGAKIRDSQRTRRELGHVCNVSTRFGTTLRKECHGVKARSRLAAAHQVLRLALPTGFEPASSGVTGRGRGYLEWERIHMWDNSLIPMRASLSLAW